MYIMNNSREKGAKPSADPWYRSWHVLPDRKDLVQDTRYELSTLALSMRQSVVGLTLSKPPFMSSKTLEIFFQAIGRVPISRVPVAVGFEAERPANQLN